MYSTEEIRIKPELLTFIYPLLVKAVSLRDIKSI